MKGTFNFFWPAILWALFILLLCSIKIGETGNSPMFFPGFDKLVHCGFFFVLVVLYCFGLLRQPFKETFSYKRVILVALIAVLYGGAIELLQLYIFTWRDGEWDDLFADAVGASMGAFSIIVTTNAVGYVKK
jgi:VanZ family protein